MVYPYAYIISYIGDTSESEELDVIIEDSSDTEENPGTNCGTSSHTIPSIKKILSVIVVFLLKLRIAFNIPDRAIVACTSPLL